MRVRVHGPDAHLDHTKTTGIDIGLQLFTDLIDPRPSTRGIGLHPVSLAAAQQLPDRFTVRLAKNVPQRDVDRADRGNCQPAPRHLRHGVAGRRCLLRANAIVEIFPDEGDVGRIPANDPRPEILVEQANQGGVVASASGRILALAPTNQTVIRFDAEDRGVECPQRAEIACMLARLFDRNLDPTRMDGLDFHDKDPAHRQRRISARWNAFPAYLMSGNRVSAVIRIWSE